MQFGRGGHAYVYLCYGLHTMLNVVADKEGVGAAVLIRSCAPISGKFWLLHLSHHLKTTNYIHLLFMLC